MSDKAKKDGPQTEFGVFELMKRVIAGHEMEPDEPMLRRIILDGFVRLEDQNVDGQVKSADSLLIDLQELILAACGLIMITTKRHAESSPAVPTIKTAIIIHQGKPSLQVWARDDGSDVRTRPLSDLEETTLFQHFAKKIRDQ